LKPIDWLVVIVLIALSNTLTLYISKNHLAPEIKKVSLIEVLDTHSNYLKNLKSDDFDEKLFVKSLEERLKEVESLVKKESGIVLLKESVVSGGEDITPKLMEIFGK